MFIQFSLLMLTLNSQQDTALATLHRFCSSNERLALVKGGAGTGKSTCIQQFVQEFLAKCPDKKVAMSAPTNKATKVLKKLASPWIPLDIATIHQLLGFRLVVDPHGYEVLGKAAGKSTLANYDVAIVDEASVINTKLKQEIDKALLPNSKTQVIFMGDPYQLPPVGEFISPVFHSVKSENTIELTSVVRQAAGNPLIRLVDAARNAVEKNLHYFYPPDLLGQISHNKDMSEGVWWLPQDSWFKQLVRAFTSPNYLCDPDYTRIITWTNERASELNYEIRRRIYGEVAAEFPYLEGERLIADDRVTLQGRTVMTTATECQVQQVSSTTVRWRNFEYKAWQLRVEDDEENPWLLTRIHDSDIHRFEKNSETLRQKAISTQRWSDFYAHQELNACLSYAYCLTTYKAQGSTFKNGFLDLKDIMRNRGTLNRNRHIYSGCSRASDRLLMGV
jgi:hypothetical protein